ncbi:MAG: hypothetical protein K2L18_11065 [Acetatifactor sp.]|nr:hypothetical protein [Acetatifactor sp.]
MKLFPGQGVKIVQNGNAISLNLGKSLKKEYAGCIVILKGIYYQQIRGGRV